MQLDAECKLCKKLKEKEWDNMWGRFGSRVNSYEQNELGHVEAGDNSD